MAIDDGSPELVSRVAFSVRLTRPKASVVGAHVGFREDELAGLLPVRAQLSLFAEGGHVIACRADGAPRAAVFGREGPV